MRRLILAALLAFFATSALAGGTTTTDDAATCPKTAKSTTATQPNDTDSTATGQNAATGTPVRSNGSRGFAPRWHSLLPGMFR